jgi:hypothetical protein
MKSAKKYISKNLLIIVNPLLKGQNLVNHVIKVYK